MTCVLDGGMCASAYPNRGLENGGAMHSERSTEEGEGPVQLESLCMECKENVRALSSSASTSK